MTKYICKACNKNVTEKTKEICDRYKELNGDAYCATHRDEKVKELGYVCAVCKEARVEPGFSICYSCRKKGLTSEIVEQEDSNTQTKIIDVKSAIIPRESLIPTVRPVISPAEARREWKELRKLKNALVERDDYIEITDKRSSEKRRFYTKKYFRKLAMYIGLSNEIVKEEIERGKAGQVISALYAIKSIAPNGRYGVGVGYASRFERSFTTEHALIALAFTRALTRSISDLVAGGEAAAEEFPPEEDDIETAND